MKIVTWNVNKFNGNNWNPANHKWQDNEMEKRDENASKIFEEVTSIIEQADDIAILQEFPYHENKWKEAFENHYTNHVISAWYYDESDKDICVETEYGVTVAVVKKDSNWERRSLSEHLLDNKKRNKVDYSNRYIELYNANKDIKLIGVHPRNAYELRLWLCQKCMRDFVPDIIAGDCNAGNYIKDDRDYEFELNREEFLRLTEGYIDVCQGMATTNYTPPTQVDHILIKNSQKFIGKAKERDVLDKNYSDHYPLYAKIDF